VAYRSFKIKRSKVENAVQSLVVIVTPYLLHTDWPFERW